MVWPPKYISHSHPWRKSQIAAYQVHPFHHKSDTSPRLYSHCFNHRPIRIIRSNNANCEFPNGCSSQVSMVMPDAPLNPEVGKSHMSIPRYSKGLLAGGGGGYLRRAILWDLPPSWIFPSLWPKSPSNYQSSIVWQLMLLLHWIGIVNVGNRDSAVEEISISWGASWVQELEHVKTAAAWPTRLAAWSEFVPCRVDNNTGIRIS